jgi:hypothetical protein
MVIALIALFVSLGGTAAALSGSNTVFTDDIADDTQPASGGNPAGGLVAADLRPNSVGTSEAVNNSLTGSDISESSLTGDAQHLIYTASATSSPAPITPIVTVGPYAIKGQCEQVTSNNSTHARIYVRGPAGTADSLWSETQDDLSDLGTHSTGLLIPANTDLQIVDVVESSNGDYRRGGGASILRSGSVLVQVDFHAVADNRGPDSCFIYGTATRAT